MTDISNINNNTNNKEDKMNIFDVIGPYNRQDLVTEPANERWIGVESIDDSREDEIGVFAKAIMEEASIDFLIHITAQANVFQVSDKEAATDLFMKVNSDGKGGLVNHDYTLVNGMDFSFVIYDEDMVVKKEVEFNSDELDLLMWWPSKESSFDAVFGPKGSRDAFYSVLKAGSSTNPFTLERGEYFINELDRIPVLFGIVEQLLRSATSSTGLHPAEIVAKAGAFTMPPMQVISEELIDIAVQADKAVKRFASLFRVGTPVNNIIPTKDDPWIFYMVEANEGGQDYILDPAFDEINSMMEDYQEQLTMESLRGMETMWHDGCIFVSTKYISRIRSFVKDRYEREGFSESKLKRALKKFDEALTFQVRVSGNGLVDQDGVAIGGEGHLKTHIMVANGAVNKWMNANGIAFFGTSDAYKKDMGIALKDSLALLVQTKAPKFDVSQSPQFFSSIDAMDAGGGAYIKPLLRALDVKLDEIINMDADELQVHAEIMVEEGEDVEEDEFGSVRRGHNELLATYGASGLSIADSPAAFYSVKSNALQRFKFATLNKDKNEDVGTEGFARRIALPIPGVRLQVFPRAFMVAGGHYVPTIKPEEIYFHLDREENIQVAVVNDETWIRVFHLTGGPDLDDFWEAMFIMTDDGLAVKLQRNPAVYGEYMIFEPHTMSLDAVHEQVIDPFGQDLPYLNLHAMPNQVDDIWVDGKKVEMVTLAEFYDKVIAPATGRLPMDQLSDDDAIYEQKKAMLTYVQMVMISTILVINNEAASGNYHRMEHAQILPSQKDLREYRAKVQEANEMGDKMPLPPKGHIGNLISAILKDVHEERPEKKEEKYEDVRALLPESIRQRVLGGPSRGNKDYGTWASYLLITICKKALEEKRQATNHAGVPMVDKNGEPVMVSPYRGGVSTVREWMNAKLEKALRQVMEQTYDNYGLILTGNPGEKRYDNTSASGNSQVQVPVTRHLRPLGELFDTDPQLWTQMSTHRAWVNRTASNTVIKVRGLDDTELGRVVHNTSVSKYVPAASIVRTVYTTEFGKLNNGGITRAETVMASRVAWLKALETVKVEFNNVNDVSDFVLALLYVLRATPHVSVRNRVFSIDETLKETYRKPENVQAESLLYSSILMNWGDEKKNLILTAFGRLQALMATMAVKDLSGDAEAFDMVTLEFPGGRANIFLPTKDGDVSVVCSNCGSVHTVTKDKAGSVLAKYFGQNRVCKNCRS